MAYANNGVLLTGLLAGADLSSKQYYFVKMASTAREVICVAATTDVSIGVLQNDPADGEEANVMCMGISKVVSGKTDIAQGEILGYDTTGRAADHTTAGRRVGAISLETQSSGAAGNYITCLIFPSNEL